MGLLKYPLNWCIALLVALGLSTWPGCSTKTTCDEVGSCDEQTAGSDGDAIAMGNAGTIGSVSETGGAAGDSLVSTAGGASGAQDLGSLGGGSQAAGASTGGTEDADAGGSAAMGNEAGAAGDPGEPEEMGDCTPEDTRPCSEGGLFGDCAEGTQTCGTEGMWGPCDITPAEEDTCEPGNDADCDGTPNEGCGCVEGTERACAVSGAKGNCAAGVEVCGPDGAYDACDIQPADEDSCDVVGDDADCDGIPNGNCPCTSGEGFSCGPETDEGLCEFGQSVCMNGMPGPCEGAVYPGSRDCSSPEDNDCDGTPDNAVDNVCKCAIGDTRECDTHPQDGIGICKAGSQTCVAQQSGAASDWGPCTDAVGPKARDCSSSADNNCDGVADNAVDSTCKCKVGTTQECDTHPQDGIGICKAGSQTCVAQQSGTRSDWSNCAGGVAPKARDCSSSMDNDCDGYVDRGTGGPSFVKVPEGYCIDSTEVTRSQYQAWLNTNPTTNGQPVQCSWNSTYQADSTCMAGSQVCQNNCNNHPQVCIDWCDAYAYCKGVGKRLCGGISGGAVAPTSSTNISFDQWHNVCTSHGDNTYPYGDSLQLDACNHYPASTSNSTVPVASLSSCQSSVNGYKGVYDLSGNVQEWEDSCANLNDLAECNVRGGFFFDEDRSMGLPCTGANPPRTLARDTVSYSAGFRCCSI